MVLRARPKTSHPYSHRSWIRLAFACWLASAATICLWSVITHLRIGLDNDTLMLSHHALRLLQGATPYTDNAQLDPPFDILLFVPPVWLTQISALSPADSLNGMALLTGLISLWLCAAVLKRGHATPMQIGVAISALALAFFSLSHIHQVFADREYFLLVLLTPWLVHCSPLAARANVSPRWRHAVALSAAAGLAIKPYGVLLYAAAFGYGSWRDRSWRTMLRDASPRILLAAGSLYLLITCLCFPHYIHDILPVAAWTYRPLSWPWPAKVDVACRQLLGGYALPGLFAMVMLAAQPKQLAGLPIYLCLLMIAALGCYLVSGGWYYTQYPFIAIALLLALAAGGRLLLAGNAFPPSRWGRCWRLLAAGGVAFASVHYFAAPAFNRAEADMAMQRLRGHPLATPDIAPLAQAAIDAQLATHPRFLWLSMDYWGVNLLKPGSGRQSVGRFDYLWPLPGILALQRQPQRRETADWLTGYLAQSIAEDITRHKPQTVISDTSPEQFYLPHDFDVLQLLTKNAPFRNAWADYRHAGTINACTPAVQSFCRYEVYDRR